MSSLTIKGSASGKTVAVINCDGHEDENLMEFLRSQGIPLASSCLGMGVCEKCVINNNLLSCMYTVAQYISATSNQPIEISYI